MSESDHSISVEFREIPEYPAYRIADGGRIQSCYSCKGLSVKGDRGSSYNLTDQWRDLRPAISHGYQVVSLCRNGVTRAFKLHRLVLVAFGPPPPFEGALARHLDGNRLNNWVSNLAWGSYADNAADTRRHGRTPQGLRHPKAKLTEDDAKAIRELVSQGRSQFSIGLQFNVSQQTVSNIVRRVHWATK